MNIPQIKQMPDTAVIPTPVTGVLSDVKPMKSGTGNYGPWTNQGAKLSQGNEFLFVNFKDREDMTHFAGQTITIAATSGQHGLNGVKVKKNGNYTNLDVTKTADVKVGQGAPAPQAPQPAPQAYHQPQQPTPPAPQSASGPIQGVVVGQALNLTVNALKDSRDPLAEEFKQDVWKLASTFIRIAQKLEKGQLAPIESAPHLNTQLPQSVQQAMASLQPASSLPTPQEVMLEDVSYGDSDPF